MGFRRVLVRSVYDAFDYCMDHYYPAGLSSFAKRKDSYAVISIQDTHTGGFGFEFRTNRFCRAVLTLYFDDVESAVPDAVPFTEEDAERIIRFIGQCDDAETLLVHCFGGESRSRAVGAFAMEMLGGRSEKLLSGGHANRLVYRTLQAVWKKQNEDPSGDQPI